MKGVFKTDCDLNVDEVSDEKQGELDNNPSPGSIAESTALYMMERVKYQHPFWNETQVCEYLNRHSSGRFSSLNFAPTYCRRLFRKYSVFGAGKCLAVALFFVTDLIDIQVTISFKYAFHLFFTPGELAL